MKYFYYKDSFFTQGKWHTVTRDWFYKFLNINPNSMEERMEGDTVFYQGIVNYNNGTTLKITTEPDPDAKPLPKPLKIPNAPPHKSKEKACRKKKLV